MSRANLQDSVNPKPLMVGITEEPPRQLAPLVGNLLVQVTSSVVPIALAKSSHHHRLHHL
jgi:hypothetical protein